MSRRTAKWWEFDTKITKGAKTTKEAVKALRGAAMGMRLRRKNLGSQPRPLGTSLLSAGARRMTSVWYLSSSPAASRGAASATARSRASTQAWSTLWKSEQGYLLDTCLTAQDQFKAVMDYFRIPY